MLGCDDSAKSEFLNKRKCKGGIAGPEQAHSNLWFVAPEQLTQFGPTTATGAVWLDGLVKAGQVSEPFLFAGWARRAAHLVNHGDAKVTYMLEVDATGAGSWSPLDRITVPAGNAIWRPFSERESGEWIRVLRQTQHCPIAH